MKKKKINYPLIGGIILGSCILVSGLYTYSYFEMYEAYRKRNYDRLKSFAKPHQYFSSHARDLLIKSALEETIAEVAFATSQNFVDPISHQWTENAHNVRISSKLATNSDWLNFFMQYYKDYNNMYNPFSSTVNLRPYVYHDLLAASKKVEFQGKKNYELSCYLYYFHDTLNQLDTTIGLYCRPILGSYDDGNTSKKNNIKQCYNFIDSYITVMNNTEYQNLNQFYFDEYEKRLCKTLTNIVELTNTVSSKEKKEYCQTIGQKLYHKFIFTAQGRQTYPRPLSIQKSIEKLHYELYERTQ